MTETVVTLPIVRLRATPVANTADEATRTVTLRWYTGAVVQRFSMWDGPSELSFDMTPKAADLSRLNAGAPLLDSHRTEGIEHVLGVVEKAWLANGQGLATVRFSERADVEPIWRDVQAGILRNVSMGAAIHELRDITAKGAKTKRLVATKWQPVELSLVAVGADGAARTLSDEPTRECRVITGDTDMNTEHTAGEVSAEVLAERARVAEIHRSVTAAKLDVTLAHELIENGSTIELAHAEVIRKLADRDEMSPPFGTVTLGHDFERGPAKFEAMAAGMAVQMAPNLVKPQSVSDSRFMHADLGDIAREVLRASGHRVTTQQRAGLIGLALSTSDFPNLLANAGNKVLREAYLLAEPTFKKIAAARTFKDFKPAPMLKVGDFPVPLQVGEGGEIKQGYFSESKETFSLLTYGRRMAFTRQSIINDDLSAFGQVMEDAGSRVADFQSALFFTMLTSNAGVGPTLGDGGALFNATAVTTAGGHANYISSGTAIDVTNLGIARAMIQKQVSLDGLKLNIQPRFLLTSPDKRTIAEQYVATLAPATASSANPFSGRLEVLSDANLSGNAWYLIGDPSRTPALIYGSLEGEVGPRIETRQGFEIEGVEMKVAFDYVAGAVDFRSILRNAGA